MTNRSDVKKVHKKTNAQCMQTRHFVFNFYNYIGIYYYTNIDELITAK